MADAGVLDRLQHFDVSGERHHQPARRLYGDGRGRAGRRARHSRGASGAGARATGRRAIRRRRRLGRDPDERLHRCVRHRRERRRRPHVRAAVLGAGAGDAGAHGDGGNRVQRRSGAQGGVAMDADGVLGARGRGPALFGDRGRAALDGRSLSSGGRDVGVAEAGRHRARAAPGRISWRLPAGRRRA